MWIHTFFQITLGNTIVSYANSIFVNAGLAKSTSHYATLIVGIVTWDGSFTFSGIANYFGRKTMYLIGCIVLCCSLIFIYIFTVIDSPLAVIIIIIFASMIFSMTISSITWIFQSELLPAKLGGLATWYYFLTWFLIMIIFPACLTSSFPGRSGTFLMFGILTLIPVFFSIFVLK